MVGLVDLYPAVLDKMFSLPRFSRVPRHKVESFCINICLVALGIRTGYLHDTFQLSGGRVSATQTSTGILSGLQTIFPEFRPVAVLLQEGFQQIFFVNTHHLCERFGSEPVSSHGDWPHFVYLYASPRMELGPSIELVALLQAICNETSETVPHLLCLPDPVRLQDVVPLTAVLLEYPVAYVPTSSDQSTFLAGIPLDVYECTLLWDASPGATATAPPLAHALLNFSCPAEIGLVNSELFPAAVIAKLRSRFLSKLLLAGISADLRIAHTVETHDRVAL